jgi:hypothetical protein
MVATSQDGYHGDYSYLNIDTSPDSDVGPGAFLEASSKTLTACAADAKTTFRLTRYRTRAITRVKVYVDGKLVLKKKGRYLRSVSVTGLPGAARHRVRVYEYTKRGLARILTRHVYGCAHH